MSEHYVYVHRRPDTGAVFYVGKGKGTRAYVKQHRNDYWRRIVAKSGPPIIEFPVLGVDEELAHLAEMELIDKHRKLGNRLTNMTDGGEGASGYRWNQESIDKRIEKVRGRKNPNISAALKGRPKSESHKRNLSDARMGHKASPEARAAMSEGQKGRVGPMLGKRHLSETKAKISAALIGEKNPFKGRRHSAESLAKMSAAHTGVKLSEETRRRMSDAKSGEKHYNFGKPVPPERKAKQIATLKARPLLTCIHCARSMSEGNLKRWHGDNCRERM